MNLCDEIAEYLTLQGEVSLEELNKSARNLCIFIEEVRFDLAKE